MVLYFTAMTLAMAWNANFITVVNAVIMDKQIIGFVGLGMMGLPMVENLVERGNVAVLAWDKDPACHERLRAIAAYGQSLTWADQLEELAQCEVVFLMLPNSPITDSVLIGNAEQTGLYQWLAAGTVVVDMGSSNPRSTQLNAGTLAQHDIALLDAPVSGAVLKARSGKLAIMVGGEEAAYQSVATLLASMGEKIIRTGAVGSAHAMKALNNYVYAAGLLAASEAVQIAKHLDLDLQVFADVLNASSGRNIATETKVKQFIIPEHFAGGFALRLQAKDLATAAALQEAAGFEAPQLSLCAALWQRASAALPAHADNTCIYQYLADKAQQEAALSS